MVDTKSREKWQAHLTLFYEGLRLEPLYSIFGEQSHIIHIIKNIYIFFEIFWVLQLLGFQRVWPDKIDR